MKPLSSTGNLEMVKMLQSRFHNNMGMLSKADYLYNLFLMESPSRDRIMEFLFNFKACMAEQGLRTDPSYLIVVNLINRMWHQQPINVIITDCNGDKSVFSYETYDRLDYPEYTVKVNY